MRKIRDMMPFPHVLLPSALLLAGCVYEEFPGADPVAEGKPARIGLNLIVPTMSSGSSARALTPEQENKIKNLWMMVSQADGSVVSNGEYVNSGSRLTINNYSSNSYMLFFIANVNDAEIEAKLQSATSLPGIEETVITTIQLDSDMNTTHPLMMTGGQENVTFAPDNSTYGISIQPHLIATKVTLIVVDKTPVDQRVNIIGWDAESTPAHSCLFLRTADVDISLPGTSAGKDDYWLTTDVDYPFEVGDKLNKTAPQMFCVFGNHRGGRVNESLLTDSTDRYPGVSFSDKDDRGRGWSKPAHATVITIKTMHKTTFETEQIKAHICLGAGNHNDYNIERGKRYTFTVTVNGLNDIKVDSNVDYVLGELLVGHDDDLTTDAHPDFRPMRIHTPKGKVTMETPDNSGRAYNDPDFDATWLKTSPSDLMWHQAKQSPPNDEWQQQVGPESRMVRPKYISHKSVRVKLQAQSMAGRSAIPGGQEDDGAMTLTNTTYRMCCRIMDIPLTEMTVTNKTPHVYADEFLMKDGKYSAQMRFVFYKEEGDPTRPEVRMFGINQEGYTSPFLDDNGPDAGLWIPDENGTSGNTWDKLVRKREGEYSPASYPGVSVGFQRLQGLTWGLGSRIAYDKDDRWGNRKFLAANIVYNDVKGVNNEAVNFGKASTSYRSMYSGEMGNFMTDIPIPPYSGGAAPSYYHPAISSFRNELYHPAYRSSLEHYCHGKNRDINGDGVIEPAETYWYLPSRDELVLFYIGIGTFENPSRYVYASVTENKEWTTGDGIAVNLFYHHLLGSPDAGVINKIAVASRAFCIRSL